MSSTAHAAGSAEIDERTSSGPGHRVGFVDGLGGGERQRWAQPLAAGEHAVAHRVADNRRARRWPRETSLERLVNLDARAFEKVREGIRGHEAQSR